MKNLYLYKDINTNQYIETYSKIIELLSDGSIILKILLDKKSGDTHLVKNKKMIIDEEYVFGDIVNNRDIMIYNKFFDLKLNVNNEFVSIYNNEYLNNNYNSLSCVFSIILEFKEYFEGKWNNGNKLFKTQPEMTYEGLLKYIYPN